jgi:hypothetical protein
VVGGHGLEVGAAIGEERVKSGFLAWARNGNSETRKKATATAKTKAKAKADSLRE